MHVCILFFVLTKLAPASLFTMNRSPSSEGIYEELSPLPPGFANKRNCCYANCIFQCLMNITPICELCRCLEAAHTSCTECMQGNCYRAILYSFIIIALSRNDLINLLLLHCMPSNPLFIYFFYTLHPSWNISLHINTQLILEVFCRTYTIQYEQ